MAKQGKPTKPGWYKVKLSEWYTLMPGAYRKRTIKTRVFFDGTIWLKSVDGDIIQWEKEDGGNE